MYQNHLKSLLKYKLLSPIPKISYSLCPECDPKMWILILNRFPGDNWYLYSRDHTVRTYDIEQGFVLFIEFLFLCSLSFCVVHWVTCGGKKGLQDKFSFYLWRCASVSSVAQSCPTLCDLINRSTPGLPVHHQLPEFTQTHVHWVGDAIQPSHPLSSPSPPAPQFLPASESFPISQLFTWGGQSTGVSALASFLPKNTQGWSPLEWTGWICLQPKGLSRVFSTPQFKSINSLALSFLHSPTLTSIHDHWKNHSLD